jgi:hypothetical protein
VVLSDAEEVESEFVGEDGLLDDVAQHPRLMLEFSIGAVGHVAKRVESEFERFCHDGSNVTTGQTLMPLVIGCRVLTPSHLAFL